MAGDGQVLHPSPAGRARRRSHLLLLFRRASGFILLAFLLPGLGCGTAQQSEPPAARPPAVAPAVPMAPAAVASLLDDLERRTFDFFWETANPETLLVPDRWPTRSFSSVAAIGYAFNAYGIGAERGYVSREAAAERTRRTLRFLVELPQGPEPRGNAGYRGFFYHFLDPETGERFERVELSTVDTALLVAGALFSEGYFDRDDPVEREIRDLAEALYRRIDWGWARPNPPAISHGWHPETGFIRSDWRGYNEAMIVYLLALGSPTHPVDPDAWEEWTRPYRLVRFHGQEYLDFAPLFGHQFSHIWVDFRGIRDAVGRRLGFDYFENSRRAVLAQRAWAIANPRGWKGLGAESWGVSACDGPADVELTVNGETRRFWTYAGRGVGPDFAIDDGTLTPMAVAGSLPFAPEVVLPTIAALRDQHGEALYGRYGFLDAFNPTFDFPDVPVHHGRVVPGHGWYDTDYLGLDQGPILAMVENYRSDLVWRVMRRNPHLRRGLERAGFTGGWLDAPQR